MKKDGMLQELTANVVGSYRNNFKYNIMKLWLIATIVFAVALSIKYTEVSTEYRMYKQFSNQCTTNNNIPVPLEQLK